MEGGADINKETTSDGWTPLLLAAQRGHTAIARALVLAGAKLDAVEWSAGNSALHIACLRGFNEIVELLATDETYDIVCKKGNKAG